MNGKKYFKNKFSIDNVSKRIFFFFNFKQLDRHKVFVFNIKIK